MGVSEQRQFTWVCDACGKTLTTARNSKPSSPADAWSVVKVDQDSGWDYHGCPWAPRQRTPAVLCGECTEKIMQIINPEK